MSDLDRRSECAAHVSDALQNYRASKLPAMPVWEAVELLKRSLREYLGEVSECSIADLDVTSLAHHLAARLRFGHATEPVTVEADATPPHGIRRPMMLVRGLDSDPFIRRG